MNLFKVLASGKRGINEENMSACLAWLLHPGMDHGLGPVFLKAFLTEISPHVESANASFKNELCRIESRITHRLRSGSEDDLAIEVELEHNAEGQGFIDVLVTINDEWTLAIENKIVAASAQNCAQLLGQYRGLLKEHGGADSPTGRRLIAFLVPPHSDVQSEEDFEKSVMTEWNELTLSELHDDGKVLVSWGNRKSRPSVEAVISRMLKSEIDGELEPFNDQIRHMLLELRRFIKGDFEGYPFSRKSRPGGQNPKTQDRLYLRELLQKHFGFIGVSGGVAGVLRYLKEGTLDNRDFQFTDQEMTGVKNWLPVSRFVAIAEAAKTGFSEVDAVFPESSDESLNLPGDLLDWLANQSGHPTFYVGIKGGADGLSNMGHRDIQGRSWGASLSRRTQQWIPCLEFSRLYKEAALRA